MNQLRSLFFQLYQRKIENTFFSLIQHGGIEAFLQIRNERRVLDDPMDFDHIYARHNALERTVAIFVLQGDDKSKYLIFLPFSMMAEVGISKIR